ncbi:MAG: ABC transporter permease, partial [Planctomycetota bacterium]
MSDTPPSMPSRITRLLGAELSRLGGRAGPVVAVAVPGLLAALTCVGYRVIGPGDDPFALFNGWGCAAKGAGIGLQAGAFVLLIVASQLASAEASSGALRSALLAPVLRRDIFAAKTVSALAWALAIFIVVWAVSLLLGAVLYGYGDVVEIIEYFGERYTEPHKTAAEMTPILVKVLLLS